MTNALLSSIMKKVSEASLKQDVVELDKLTKLAKRVRDVEDQQGRLSAELQKIKAALADDSLEVLATEGHPGAPRKGLRITIDWRSAGHNRDSAKIDQAKASKALVSFLGEIHSVLGDAALEKLTGLRISRGPLVSREPKRDFINGGDGSIYIHHPIPGTKYFVITHSGTTEKMEAIRAAARLLGLKNAVAIERIQIEP